MHPEEELKKLTVADVGQPPNEPQYVKYWAPKMISV
jgi:hypothetical protein